MSKSQIIDYKRSISITRNREFEKKGLATHGLDVGLSCDHGCTYCSTPSILRTHPAFVTLAKSAYAAHHDGDVIIDLNTPSRIAEAASNLTSEDVVMFSPKTDPWCPASLKYGLGRDCLKVLLETNDKCHVRILTKNVAVVDTLKGLTKFKDRIHVSLSITAPRGKSHLAAVMEPGASSCAERLDALRQLKNGLGFNVFGMICPCVPGLLTDKADLEEVIGEIIELDPERIWFEGVNGRGPSLLNTEQAFLAAGHTDIANAIKAIRDDQGHDAYVFDLVEKVNEVGEKLGCASDLRGLVYNDLRSKLASRSNVVFLSSHKRETRYVNASDVKRDKAKPKRHIDAQAQADLELSISSEGILEPLLVREAEGTLILTAGERRLRAAKKLGIKKVPVIIINEEMPSLIAMKENLLRENLGPIELAEGFKRMKDECGYSQADLGEMFGKAKSTISEILSLDKLPTEIKDLCRKEPDKYPLHELKLVAKKKSVEGAKRAFTALQAKVSARGKASVSGKAEKASPPMDWFTAGVSALTKSVQENIAVAPPKDAILRVRAELVALKAWIEALLKDVSEPEDSQPEKFVNANSGEHTEGNVPDQGTTNSIELSEPDTLPEGLDCGSSGLEDYVPPWVAEASERREQIVKDQNLRASVEAGTPCSKCA